MSLTSIYRDGRYYDLEFDGWSADIPFYTSLIEAEPGPVLELCCGTGRVTIPIAKLNVPIVGLDLIPSMLEQAKMKSEKANVGVEWLQGDMTKFSLGRQFQWILMPFNSMQHLHKWEELKSTLSCIRQHLLPSGTFAFDVVNPIFPDLTAKFSSPRKVKEFDDPDGNGRVQIEVCHSYDAVTRIARHKLIYSIGERRNIREEEIVLNCFDPEELLNFLEMNGFAVTEVYGSYRKESFSPKSKELVVLCKAE